MTQGSTFGEILVEAGVIDSEQREGYQERSRKQNRPMGEMLVEDSVCTEDQICQALSIHLGIPPVALSQIRIPGYVAKMLPREDAIRISAIPVSVKKEGDEDVLYVAFSDPTDIEILTEVEKLTRRKIRPVVSAASDIRKMIDRYHVEIKRPKSRKPKEDASSPEAVAAPEKEAPLQEAIEETDAWNVVDGEDLPPLPEIEDDNAETDDDILAEEEPELEVMEIQADAPKESSESADIGVPEEIAVEPVATESMDEDLDADALIDEMEIDLDDIKVDFEPEEPADQNSLDMEFEASDTDDFKVDDGRYDSTDGQQTGDTGDSQDFLKFDSGNLGEEDNRIIAAQEEADKVRQEKPFGVDIDVDFSEGQEDKESSSKPDDDPFTQFDEDEDFGDDIDFDVESDTDSPTGPDMSEEQPPTTSTAIDETDDFDDLDFDIPEAPDFDSNATSASLATVNEDQELSEKTSPNESQVLSSEDWSLDIDDLLSSDSLGKEDPIDFEMAASELDRLLDGDSDQSSKSSGNGADSSKLRQDLINQLSGLLGEQEFSGEDEDIQYIYEFLSGKHDPLDPKMGKLEAILSTMTNLMIEKGVIEEPDFLKSFFENYLKTKKD